MVADTYRTLGFYYNGAGAIMYFVDRNLIATHTTYIPTAHMRASMGLLNGSAVAHYAYVDYEFIVAER